MSFQKATRNQIRLRIGLIGPSGSGKTYSALRLAKGMGGKTLLIDTEAGRGKIYADEFDYYYEEMAPPFTPERYIELINRAEAEGFDVIIIDSSSHEWFNLLDAHDKLPDKNKYTSWAKITPRHDAFIDKIIRAKAHLICTMRGKDQYVLEEKEGRSNPKKVGIGAQQRDGFEYEFHATFNIDQSNNIATATKDNTHRFSTRYEKLSEEDGAFLIQWANQGEPKAEPAKPQTPTAQQPAAGPGNGKAAPTEQPKANVNSNVTTTEKIKESAALRDSVISLLNSVITLGGLRETWELNKGAIKTLLLHDLNSVEAAKDRVKERMMKDVRNLGPIVMMGAEESDREREAILDEIRESLSYNHLNISWNDHLLKNARNLTLPDQNVVAAEFQRMLAAHKSSSDVELEPANA